MAWPCAADYNASIQNLRTSVSDQELREGEVACDVLGLPAVYSGNFADVYRVHCPATSKDWAIKCFTRQKSGLQERYREISKHLQQSKLPFMVECHYVEPGIRVNGNWQPFLKMRWVEGVGLNQFVGAQLDHPKMLQQLLQLWGKLAARLQEKQIVHADLQHGNVLLVPVPESDSLSLKLIDYDGMHIPPLAQLPSGESGHACYQHPQRFQKGIYSAEVDHFSHLTICTAIRCLLTGGGRLWERYNNQENLLFRQVDFENPARSEVFRELWSHEDQQARAMVGRLILASQAPLSQTPPLNQIMHGDQVVLLSVEQEQQAVALMANGQTQVAVPPVPTNSSLIVEPEAVEPEIVEPELVEAAPLLPPPFVPTGTGPETIAKPPLRDRLSWGSNILLLCVRSIGRLLAILAGEGNVILQNIFRILTVIKLAVIKRHRVLILNRKQVGGAMAAISIALIPYSPASTLIRRASAAYRGETVCSWCGRGSTGTAFSDGKGIFKDYGDVQATACATHRHCDPVSVVWYQTTRLLLAIYYFLSPLLVAFKFKTKVFRGIRLYCYLLLPLLFVGLEFCLQGLAR